MDMYSKISYLNQKTYNAALLQSQAFRALNNFMNEILKNYFLTLSEWKLLGHLNETPAMTPTQIAKMLAVKLPIGSRVIKNLEQKHLLIKKQSTKDSRVYHICITEKGAKLVNEIELEIRSKMRIFLGDINRDELNIYLKVLGQIASKV